MKMLLQYILQNNLDGLHSGLVVGAGNGSRLADWRQLGCRHLLLTEAHPRQAEELSRRLRHEKGETLLALAVTTDELPTATLQPLNNLAYSSLNVATDLFKHYPNLRNTEAVQVPARSLKQLLQEQALDEQLPHMLVIAAPGQAMHLLQETPACALQAFTWLLIECSCEPLYLGDVGASDIIAWLLELGYDLITDDPDAVYPLSQLLFKRNFADVKRRQLSDEIVELRSQLLNAAQISQQQIEALQRQSQQSDDKLAKQARLADERQIQIDSLTKESADLAATRDALDEAITSLKIERDELINLATERLVQIEALAHEKAELIATREALGKDKAALIAARDELTNLAAECQAQVEALAQDKAQLTADRDALAEAKVVLTQTCDDQAKLLSDFEAKIGSLDQQNSELTTIRDVLSKVKNDLTKTRDEQAKLLSEHQSEIDLLRREKADIAAARDVLAKEKTELTKTRDDQTKLANDRKEQLDKIIFERDQVQKSAFDSKKSIDSAQLRIKALEYENNESQHRQRLLHDELVRAEAQIDLIKDLLLREPGL
jgi:hypothetical protein